MFELTDGRDYAYQWDTGLYVDCTGLAESDEVHFCRPGITLALHPAMQGETLVARVPDELLQQAQPIIIFAYVQTATGEITKVSTRLCVTARPKPPGYISTPTEALRWGHLQEQIENLQEQIDDLADPEAVQQIVEDYLAENPPTVTETDPTVPEWAKAAQKPSYTAFEVGADPSGTAASQLSAHNTGTDTHSDIRLLISGLTDRLNALADSDDTTLDQLSEVVAYIKSNRELIAAITTDKVSVADIVNNLTTNVANKPLSAAQGVVLKAMIDAISIPDKLPNPNALTFTGAVTGSYDGSEALTVEIPAGGGGSGAVGNLKLELIASGTMDADARGITVNLDNDGNPFELSIAALRITNILRGADMTHNVGSDISFGSYWMPSCITATTTSTNRDAVAVCTSFGIAYVAHGGGSAQSAANPKCYGAFLPTATIKTVSLNASGAAETLGAGLTYYLYGVRV